MTKEISPVVCKNCAMHLIRQCYGKHWWFRLVREPLVWGMRILAWGNGIDARTHGVVNQKCHGCVRFMKAELEKSRQPSFFSTTILDQGSGHCGIRCLRRRISMKPNAMLKKRWSKKVEISDIGIFDCGAKKFF